MTFYMVFTLNCFILWTVVNQIEITALNHYCEYKNVLQHRLKRSQRTKDKTNQMCKDLTAYGVSYGSKVGIIFETLCSSTL